MPKLNIFKIISGSLLITGTIIGAGMLAIPLVTFQAGFLPAVIITILVWVYMCLTGLLFLEATLWMHKDANILSMSKRFLGNKGKIFAGANFIFLYFCLMVAYFAAGAPLLKTFVLDIFNINISGWAVYGIYGLIFGTIVYIGIKFVDRVNYILMIGLILSYMALVFAGNKAVEIDRLFFKNYKALIFVAPVLFTSFGFHNVIPSLTFYFKENIKVMRWAIILGSFIPLIIYIVWQYLIIGAVSKEALQLAYSQALPVTDTLQSITNVSQIKSIGSSFALFAIVTSMLGVSFSIVDFLGDGLKLKRFGRDRLLLCLLTFIPPFVLSSLDPSLFIIAIGIAGGFGEAFLNGILPAMLVWIGRYKMNLTSKMKVFGGKITLLLIFLIGALVMLIEMFFIFKEYVIKN